MSGLRDYFPTHAWVVIFALTAVAGLGLLVPPSAGAAVGLSVAGHILVVAGVEFGCAIGIAAVVLHYRQPVEERADDAEPEWRFDP